MEGTYLYSPFYPKAGGNANIGTTFRIQSFTNSTPINERGVPLSQVTFTWSYTGVPTTQSIVPFVGELLNNLRTYTLDALDLDILIEEPITDTTTFTLTASDSSTLRTATTGLIFVNPIFFGTVPSAAPSVEDILGMNRRIALFEAFRVSLIIADEHSCFASPMTNPITDIVETIFGLSVLGTYKIIDNVPLRMADGLIVPYRIFVKAVPEHTLGQNFLLNIVF